jgi:hypothetical protein
VTLINGVRCPNCKDRVIRFKDDHAVLLINRLVVHKSDGRIEGACPRCKAPVTFSPEMSDALRSTIFLKVTKGVACPSPR